MLTRSTTVWKQPYVCGGVNRGEGGGRRLKHTCKRAVEVATEGGMKVMHYRS